MTIPPRDGLALEANQYIPPDLEAKAKQKIENKARAKRNRQKRRLQKLRERECRKAGGHVYDHSSYPPKCAGCGKRLPMFL